MKVAVTSQGPDLNSQVAVRFGRAPYLLIVDTTSGEFAVRDNSGYLDTPHTAGMQAAGAIVSLGVRAVIARNIGPRAFATLQAGDVAVYTVTCGTVEDAIAKFKAGQLQSATKAKTEEHWTQRSE